MIDGLLESGSYLGIIVVLILTGCGLPVPEEVAIIAAGVLSSTGDLSWKLALPSCLVGALLGDCVMYYVGRRFGRSILQEHPRWAGFMTPAREKRIEQMIHQHGFKVFLVARFLVGLRGPVYVTAGILHVPFWRFLLIDLVCATIVIGLFFGLSFVYGDEIYGWIRQAEVGFTVLVVAILLVVGLLYWRHRRKLAQIELEALERAARTSPTVKTVDGRGDSSKNVA